MFLNEAVWDRVLRFVVGALLLYLGWSGQVAGGLGTFLKWFGFLPLLTGLVGYCPAYTIFKVRTKKS
jgi:hypothetical protein